MCRCSDLQKLIKYFFSLNPATMVISYCVEVMDYGWWGWYSENVTVVMVGNQNVCVARFLLL